MYSRGTRSLVPTGIGVLYGKAELLETMPPVQGGGDMIKSVTFENTIYNDLPYKFEAGTPNIAGAIGLGAAIDYVQSVGYDSFAAYEDEVLDYGTKALESIEGLRIIGTAPRKAGILSFVIENIHPPRHRHDPGRRGSGSAHRSPLRPAGNAAFSRYRPPPGLHWPCTIQKKI